MFRHASATSHSDRFRHFLCLVNSRPFLYRPRSLRSGKGTNLRSDLAGELGKRGAADRYAAFLDMLPKQPIPLAVQVDIRDRLKPEIDQLGIMLGRDLSHWLEVREGRLG